MIFKGPPQPKPLNESMIRDVLEPGKSLHHKMHSLKSTANTQAYSQPANREKLSKLFIRLLWMASVPCFYLLLS